MPSEFETEWISNLKTVRGVSKVDVFQDSITVEIDEELFDEAKQIIFSQFQAFIEEQMKGTKNV